MVPVIKLLFLRPTRLGGPFSVAAGTAAGTAAASSLMNADSERAGRAGRDIITGDVLLLFVAANELLIPLARLPGLLAMINFFAAPHRVNPERFLRGLFSPPFWGLPGAGLVALGDVVIVGLAVLLDDSEETR